MRAPSELTLLLMLSALSTLPLAQGEKAVRYEEFSSNALHSNMTTGIFGPSVLGATGINARTHTESHGGIFIYICIYLDLHMILLP